MDHLCLIGLTCIEQIVRRAITQGKIDIILIEKTLTSMLELKNKQFVSCELIHVGRSTGSTVFHPHQTLLKFIHNSTPAIMPSTQVQQQLPFLILLNSNTSGHPNWKHGILACHVIHQQCMMMKRPDNGVWDAFLQGVLTSHHSSSLSKQARQVAKLEDCINFFSVLTWLLCIVTNQIHKVMSEWIPWLPTPLIVNLVKNG